MYDPLRTRYVLSCPTRGETAVTLSAFRRLERLPGAVHPAVFAITFSCPCGDEHPGLVAHDDLDWAPLGLGAGSFVDLMTDRVRDAGEGSAKWPPDSSAPDSGRGASSATAEDRPQPVFPSSFTLLAPGSPGGVVGVAVRRPHCEARSINLVSHAHIDLPFHNDAEVGVVEHVFEADAERAVEEFRPRALLRRVRLAPASALALPRRRCGRRERSAPATAAMMNDVAPETPTPRRPSQIRKPRPSPQRNEMTP